MVTQGVRVHTYRVGNFSRFSVTCVFDSDASEAAMRHREYKPILPLSPSDECPLAFSSFRGLQKHPQSSEEDQIDFWITALCQTN